MKVTMHQLLQNFASLCNVFVQSIKIKFWDVKMYPHQWVMQKQRGLYSKIIDSLYQYYNNLFNFEGHSGSSECYDLQATLTR